MDIYLHNNISDDVQKKLHQMRIACAASSISRRYVNKHLSAPGTHKVCTALLLTGAGRQVRSLSACRVEVSS